jgi:hypothetical protein
MKLLIGLAFMAANGYFSYTNNMGMFTLCGVIGLMTIASAIEGFCADPEPVRRTRR